MDKHTFLIELSESERTDFGKVDFVRQSSEQKVFSSIWALEGEVNMGGFEGWFGRVEGQSVIFAPEALQRDRSPPDRRKR